jgi:hypothetical protein
VDFPGRGELGAGGRSKGGGVSQLAETSQRIGFSQYDETSQRGGFREIGLGNLGGMDLFHGVPLCQWTEKHNKNLKLMLQKSK